MSTKLQLSENSINHINQSIDNFEVSIKKFQDSVKISLEEQEIKELEKLKAIQKFSTEQSLEDISETLKTHKSQIENFKHKFIDKKLQILSNTVDGKTNLDKLTKEFDIFYKKLEKLDKEVSKKLKTQNWFKNTKIAKNMEKKWRHKTVENINGLGIMIAWVRNFLFGKKEQIEDDTTPTFSREEKTDNQNSNDTKQEDETVAWSWIYKDGNIVVNSTDSEESQTEEKNDEDSETPQDDVLDTEVSGSGIAWTATAWIAWAWALNKTTSSISENINSKNNYKPEKSNIDIEKTKQTFKEISEELSKNPRLTPEQIKLLSETWESIEDAESGLVAWRKLWKTIPQKLFSERNISNDVQNQMSKVIKNISDDDRNKLLEIKNKNIWNEAKIIEERDSFLKSKNILVWNENVLKLLTKANDLDTLKNISQVVKSSKAISKLSSAFLILDAYAFYLEFKFRSEWMDYAEEMAKFNKDRAQNFADRTNFRFYVWNAHNIAWLGLALTWVIGGLAWVWPPWRIVLVAGLWLYANEQLIAQTADSYYFDVVDFYSRWPELFELKPKTKQFITASMNKQDIAINEKTAFYIENLIGESEINKNDKIKKWWEALVVLDEVGSRNNENIEKYNLIINFLSSKKSKEIFLQTLNKDDKIEFKKQRKEAFEERLKFILNIELPRRHNDPEFDIVPTFQDMDEILARSKTYQKMLIDWEISNVDDYKANKLMAIQQKSPEFFANLEKLYSQNIKEFLELYHWSQIYQQTSQDEETETRTQFIKDFYEAKIINIPYEKIPQIWEITFSAFDYKDIKDKLLNLESGKKFYSRTRNDEQIQTHFSENIYWSYFLEESLQSNYEFSESFGQNLLYQLLKWMNWYMWKNNILDMINFLKPENADFVWVYYEDWLKLNIDRWLDEDIDLYKFDKISSFTDIEKITNKKTSSMEDAVNVVIEDLFVEKQFWWLLEKDNLDSAVESIDTSINKQSVEFLKKAIQTELEYKIQKKDKVQKQILDYIKSNTENQNWFLMIPEYLNSERMRITWEDLIFFFWKYDEKTKKYLQKSTIGFKSKKQTLVNSEFMPVELNQNKLSPEQISKIDIIDAQKEKLNNMLKSKFSSKTVWTNLTKIITKDISDRDMLKENLLTYKDYEAKLESWYQKFYNLFVSYYITIMKSNNLKLDETEIIKQAQFIWYWDFFGIQKLEYNKTWNPVLDKYLEKINNKNMIKIPDWFLNKIETQFFVNIITNYKILYKTNSPYKDKTIFDLFQWTENEQQAGIELSKIVLMWLMKTIYWTNWLVYNENKAYENVFKEAFVVDWINIKSNYKEDGRDANLTRGKWDWDRFSNTVLDTFTKNLQTDIELFTPILESEQIQ